MEPLARGEPRRWTAAGIWTGAARRRARAAPRSRASPRRRNQRPDDGRYTRLDRTAYRERNRIERLVNRRKQPRRIATRYEKRAAHYLVMLLLATAPLWP